MHLGYTTAKTARDLSREKYCTDCQRWKPNNSYGMRSVGSGIYRATYCKACMAKRTAKWRKRKNERR